MTVEAIPNPPKEQRPYEKFIEKILPQLSLIHTQPEAITAPWLQGCTLLETGEDGVQEIIKKVVGDANEKFRKIRGIVNPEERNTLERRQRISTALALFNRLGMLGDDKETLERFVGHYYNTEIAQESSTDATARTHIMDLMDTYDQEPASRAINALGAEMGQSDKNVVLLRRTVLTLLEESGIPAPKPQG